MQPTRPELTPTDRLLTVVERALRSLTGADHAARPYPAGAGAAGDAVGLSGAERREAGALMRVNHVGEVCAQALYTAQALAARGDTTRRQFETAARDETDHLAWTRQRLRELGARPSLLNPLWYAGAFGFGLLAARAGDRVSLGFVVETERQVEQHLESHLGRLPAADTASRAIVQQMKDDEARHGAAAERAGGVRLPAPVRWAMRGAAKVMTTTAHHL
ncbi:2-polyprenyl-3-methyl-6-methoxy-1,4-benzoquinone monooxygenase [Piscinibacter koreensis]|uniref:3-demethoxyubiquinol 3-hydroxylase n=1 Tax=Piscinibacter koreensis TaxID=2742824 RepID=A0A7Y6NLY0_9BURK|nr:2-polyprenyl-3-methyl-6-methoxy-1,4-benzoquinone monooxygenase [Schlegelella koreensis]NUZ05626.1 2-polyprenyl-3-methyl-6-methoxy-1,4-benzoquinone monooxygenase [Schlegelella koreensis]